MNNLQKNATALPSAVFLSLKILICLLTLLLAGQALKAGEQAALPYLVALDFTTDAKNKPLGGQIARMFRNKTVRAKVCTADTEIDWEELSGKMPPPDGNMTAEEIAAAASEQYDGCAFLVWGDIRNAEPGKIRSRSLRLKFNVLDVRGKSIIVSREMTVDNNFAISQAVDEIVKAFRGVPTRQDIAAADPANFQEAFGGNLCPYGDLVPPGGTGVLPGWTFSRAENIMLRRGEDGKNFLEYDVSKGEVAEITGLFAYTPYIPIKPNTYYQVEFWVRTDGPRVIQFTKGYRKKDAAAGAEEVWQDTFKHQVRFYGGKGEWGCLRSKPFLPRAVRPGDMPTALRVQLYAYWPIGKVCFRDVVVRECRKK